MELRNRKITKRLFLRTIYKKTQFFGSVSSMKGGQKMDDKDLVGRERKCPVCEKVFILVDDDWAYKRIQGHKTMYFCSWGCMGKYDNTRPKKVAIDQREDLIRMLKEGIDDGDLTTSKTYIKGENNEYAAPLVKELPKHSDAANRTAGIILDIIVKLGRKAVEDDDAFNCD